MRRGRHRAECVRSVKRTYRYIAAWTAQVPRPRTPDPTSRHLRKRPWERAVQQWIMDLKGVVSQLPPERKIVIELLASIVHDVLKSRVQSGFSSRDQSRC